MLKKMRAAEFHQWAEPILRYLPEGGTWWRGRYSHFRFLDEWFVVEIYVRARYADWFDISPVVYFMGAYNASIVDSPYYIPMLDGGLYPWRLVEPTPGMWYEEPSHLQWYYDRPDAIDLMGREYAQDPRRVFDEYTIFAAHATAAEMKSRIHWVQVRPGGTVEPLDTVPAELALNWALIEALGGDSRALESDIPVALERVEPSYPVHLRDYEVSSRQDDQWYSEAVRVRELRAFVDGGGSLQDLRSLVGGWAQEWKDAWFARYKPKPVLGASIPFEDRSMLPWALRAEDGSDGELREEYGRVSGGWKRSRC